MVPGILRELAPQQQRRVADAFTAAIAKSYVDDGKAGTQAEHRRRFDLCLKIFSALRGDLKWSIDRALDHLSVYLRCELDGLPWKPDQRAVWLAGD